MESVLTLMFSKENVRMLVLLAFGFGCFVWQNSSFERRMDSVESSLNRRIDGLDSKIDGDFKRLNDAIEALTFTLSKNGYLKSEDKVYIDSRLSR